MKVSTGLYECLDHGGITDSGIRSEDGVQSLHKPQSCLCIRPVNNFPPCSEELQQYLQPSSLLASPTVCI